MKTILWFPFIVLLVWLELDVRAIKAGTTEGYTPLQLQFADEALGKPMLCAWQNKPFGVDTLLGLVRRSIHTDFFFIISYTLLLFVHSNAQMQRERTSWLNTLLRLNLFLAILTGLLDVTENLILLYNIRHVADPGVYLSTCCISRAKWLIGGWALLVWLFSVLHVLLTGKNKGGFIQSSAT